MNKKIQKLTNYEQYLEEFLKNPEHKKLFDECGRQLELSYAMLQLRKKKKLSQAILAKKIGTTQSNVARMEGGNQNFTVAMLDKIASAFDKRLEIQFK